MKRYLLIVLISVCSLAAMGGRPHRVYKRPPYQYNLNAAYKCIEDRNFSAASDSLLRIHFWTNERLIVDPFIIPEMDDYLDYLEDHPLPPKVEKKFLKRYVTCYHVYFWADLYIETILYPIFGWSYRPDEDLSTSSWTYERNFTLGTRIRLSHQIRRVRDLKQDKTLSTGLYALWKEKNTKEDLLYLQKAYDVSSQITEPGNLYQSAFAFCIGDVSLQNGDLAKADQYLNLSVLSNSKEIRSMAYKRLGDLHRDMGYYEKAEQDYKESLKLNRKYNRISNNENLAALAYRKGDFAQAEQYLTNAQKERYRQLYQRFKGSIHITDTIRHAEITNPYYICSLLSEDAEGKGAVTKSMLVQYESSKKRYISHSFDLGSIYLSERKYIFAEKYIKQALSEARSANEGIHPEYQFMMRRMIQVYDAMNRPWRAMSYLYESFDVNKKRFVSSVSFLSEQQRAKYWNTLYSGFQDLYPYFVYKHHERFPKLMAFAYDNELFTKGLLLTSSNAVQQSVQESGDSTLMAQWEQFTTLKQAIMALQEKAPDTALIPQYEKRAEELEKIITVNSAAYRENMQQWSITWDSVRKALKPQQVAIEYMSAPINEDSTMYCALLLRDTCSQPILIPLFEQKEVDSLLERYTDTVYLAIQRIYAYDERGKALSERIWNNVKPYLHTGDTVYFSATGLLHQIAIENLWYDSTHTMADTYTMVRLSSTRELAIHRAPIQNETATLYGGIKYSAEAQTMVDVYNMQKYNTPAQEKFLTYNQTRGGLTHADPLTATQYEISASETILKGKHFHVDVLSGHMANEESFKHLSGQKKNILHVATHGFYTPDSTYQNPLERCGLLFAGANLFIDGNIQQVRDIDENVGDGIVTAKDISLMDLRGADIVVLSACETGLGDVTGEGVFGLQRAFKMAGAQTLIMSLWQVHDLSTQLLMTAFYRHWIEKGESKREAFRAAQQEVRNSGFESPYYWAGFILLD